MYVLYIHVLYTHAQHTHAHPHDHTRIYAHMHTCTHTCTHTHTLFHCFLDMTHKEVCLQRTIDIHGHPGGFGFSVLGGAGTKFPAVVCEVDTGGPAALSGKVSWLSSPKHDSDMGVVMCTVVRNVVPGSNFVVLLARDRHNWTQRE